MLSVADETGDTIGAGQRAPSLNRLESVGGVADVDAAVSQQPTDLARADATSNDDPVGLFTIARDATDATARQEAVDLEGSHCGTAGVPFQKSRRLDIEGRGRDSSRPGHRINASVNGR